MRRIKTYGTFIGAESGKPSLVLSQRDYHLMRAVVRSVQDIDDANNCRRTDMGPFLPALDALDAFNAPEKRK